MVDAKEMFADRTVAFEQHSTFMPITSVKFQIAARSRCTIPVVL